MFTLQGFLNLKSKLADELQTPQLNSKIPDGLPCESLIL